MSLPNNGRNHNHNPIRDGGDDIAFVNPSPSGDSDRDGAGYSPSVKENVDYASPSQNASDINPETGTNSHASAYDDLDDYVYRQNKRRHRRRQRRRGLRSILGMKQLQHKHRHHHSKHHHRRKRLKKWQKASIGIISTLLALIVLLIGTVAYLNMAGEAELTNSDNLSVDVPEGIESSDNGMYIVYKGVQYKYNENIASILCMGIDRETLGNIKGHVGTGGDSDALFLITIDNRTGETNLVNISRETMTDIGIYSSGGNYIETAKAQICLAYAYGDGKETSCRNQLVAVKQLFYNIPINSYLSLDMEGIGAINDTMGGITVVSPETIGTFISGETYNLRGSQAQSFVRDRSHETIEGNNLRMERQKVYLESFARQLIDKTKQNLSTPIDVFNASKPYVCTNLNAARITNLAINAIRGGYNDFEIRNIPGEVKKGKTYAEFYVNEEKFFEMFLEIFYDPVENFR